MNASKPPYFVTESERLRRASFTPCMALYLNGEDFLTPSWKGDGLCSAV